MTRSLSTSAPQIVDAVVCGGGLSGLSAAYWLKRLGAVSVTVLDPATAANSAPTLEGFRSFFPGPDGALSRLADRSVRLLEAISRNSDNAIGMRYAGVVSASARWSSILEFEQEVSEANAYTQAIVREFHDGDEGYSYKSTFGSREICLVSDEDLIMNNFPFLSKDVKCIYHLRRAGVFEAEKLKEVLRKQLYASGVKFINAKAIGIEKSASNEVRAVIVASQEQGGQKDPFKIRTPNVVLAVGSTLKQVACEHFGVDPARVPVLNEMRTRLEFNDIRQHFSRSSPTIVWKDSLRLESKPNSKQREVFPAGMLIRPTHRDTENVKNSTRVSASWHFDSSFENNALSKTKNPLEPNAEKNGISDLQYLYFQALAKIIPKFQEYAESDFRKLDARLYSWQSCKTKDNIPLIGPLDPKEFKGLYVIGALSDSEASLVLGAGEIIGAHICDQTELIEKELQPFFTAMLPSRNSLIETTTPR